MSGSRFKLRVFLFVACTLISTIPVFMLTAWVQRSAEEKEIAAVREKHLIIARNLSGALSRYVNDIEANFRLMASNLAIDANMAGAKELLKSLHIKGICILDANDALLHELRADPDKSIFDLPKDSLKALRTKANEKVGQVVFSDLLRHAGRPAFLIGLVQGQGELVVGILKPDYLIKMQKSIVFGERGHSMIVDRTGHVVAHPNKQWQETSKNASKLSVVQKMMRGETGVAFFYSPPMKADMVAGHTSVPKVGWGVMVPQPMSELLERSRDVQGVAVGISFLGILIAGLISWGLSRFLARPIEQVRNAARHIANGDLKTRIDTVSSNAPIELHELSQSFNRMVTQIDSAHAKLEEAAIEAQQANRAKSEFLANMSHELRTPLHGVISFADLGAENIASASTEKLTTYFQRIRQSGGTLLKMLNALLDLSKLEAGKMDFDLKPADLGDLIAGTVEEFSSLASQKGLVIQYSPPQSPVEVLVDPEKIIQVLRNLLNNAVKFSPEGAVVCVEMEQKILDAVVSIHDQGPGIPDEEMETIFEKFTQSSRTNTGAGGTGLGLAICREIISMHQGSIWAEKGPGGGTVMMFELPLLEKTGESRDSKLVGAEKNGA